MTALSCGVNYVQRSIRRRAGVPSAESNAHAARPMPNTLGWAAKSVVHPPRVGEAQSSVTQVLQAVCRFR